MPGAAGDGDDFVGRFVKTGDARVVLQAPWR
jgi:hypothetical protein